MERNTWESSGQLLLSTSKERSRTSFRKLRSMSTTTKCWQHWKSNKKTPLRSSFRQKGLAAMPRLNNTFVPRIGTFRRFSILCHHRIFHGEEGKRETIRN